ncbi:uncharacterized protein [Aegilops tauschii subsp. strangulata]|uniref:uncharacterized protein n=1 Tax=Aegilops tauschii subsp. strangulata TaxID=200361 RepID=UPI00098AE7CA|nr:methyl-CpG-binding domain-containing protein 4-like [Aegilops tauschii subsp. strangulata]
MEHSGVPETQRGVVARKAEQSSYLSQRPVHLYLHPSSSPDLLSRPKKKRPPKIPVKEDFEIIWKSFVEDSLLYDTYPSARRSGQQPEDISHGSSRIWVMDETSISQSRLEMERQVITQGGFSKMYNQYLLPNRKRAWAGGNDEKFMQDNSLYVAKLSTLKLYFVMLKNVKETV